METCLNPTINTNIHTLFSIRLQQGGTAANIHLNCPKGSTRLFSTIQTLKFLERLLKLWRLKTSPTFLMENKVWHHHLNFLFFFPAEPQIQETWGKKKKSWSWKKRLLGQMNWRNNQWEAAKNGLRKVKLVPSGDQSQGVRLHRGDGEFFPLRSQPDSSASRCPTDTRGGDKTIVMIIRG